MAIAEEVTLREIEARLRAKLPPGVVQLDAEHLSDLLAVIDEARHGQAAELQEAGEKAFRHVPRLLRAPIRRIMG